MAYKMDSFRGVKGVEKGMEASCLLPYKLQVVHAIHEQIRSGLISMDRSEGRSMRVFIALDVPDQLRRELCACTGRLSDHLLGRFVPCESYHLTLAFMGELDEGQVDDAVAALNDLSAQSAPAILAPRSWGRSASLSTRFCGWAWSPARSCLFWPNGFARRWQGAACRLIPMNSCPISRLRVMRACFAMRFRISSCRNPSLQPPLDSMQAHWGRTVLHTRSCIIARSTASSGVRRVKAVARASWDIR